MSLAATTSPPEAVVRLTGSYDVHVAPEHYPTAELLYAWVGGWMRWPDDPEQATPLARLGLEHGDRPVCVSWWGPLATHGVTGDALTRLVFLAHDYGVQVSLHSRSVYRVDIVLTPRQSGSFDFDKGHPRLVQALVHWATRYLPGKRPWIHTGFGDLGRPVEPWPDDHAAMRLSAPENWGEDGEVPWYARGQIMVLHFIERERQEAMQVLEREHAAILKRAPSIVANDLADLLGIERALKVLRYFGTRIHTRLTRMEEREAAVSDAVDTDAAKGD